MLATTIAIIALVEGTTSSSYCHGIQFEFPYHFCTTSGPLLLHPWALVAATVVALAWLWLCFGCALAVRWLCIGCGLAVVRLWFLFGFGFAFSLGLVWFGLCFGCALAVLWRCFGCAVAVLGCALAVLELYVGR